jgi:hypothetical protein
MKVRAPKLQVHLTGQTSAPSHYVLAALHDFGDRRARIWPNVTQGHFQVHDGEEASAHVTEELWPTGIWERCRYEWSQAGSITATVVESNALRSGSSYAMTLTPIDAGTRVEVQVLRDFMRGPRGRFAEGVNRVAGRWLLAWDLRRALSAIEKDWATDQSAHH